MAVFSNTSPKPVFGCKKAKVEDPNTPECVACIANLTLPVPPGTGPGTRYIVTNTSGMIHPTWINLPAGLSDNDIIEKDSQNLNWLLALDISEEPCDGGGIIVYVECKCHNYWYDECNGCWKEISACSFWGDLLDKEFCVTTNGQTQFQLDKIAEHPDKSLVVVNGVDYQYGVHYIISGTILTWLDVPFTLDTCDKLTIKYC